LNRASVDLLVPEVEGTGREQKPTVDRAFTCLTEVVSSASVALGRRMPAQMSIKALRLRVVGRTGPGMKAAAQIAGV
jgi:hypothetical protein